MCSRILWHWNVNDLFERRGTAASIWQKDASQKNHEICIRAWGSSSGDLLIADCGDFENLSASDSHVERSKHQEVAQEAHTDVSSSSIFLNPLAAKCPLGNTPVQDEKEEQDTFSNEKTVKTFGAVVASSFAITQYIEESCTSHFISIRQCVRRTRTTPPNTR